jgi:hypothetical protein
MLILLFIFSSSLRLHELPWKFAAEKQDWIAEIHEKLFSSLLSCGGKHENLLCRWRNLQVFFVLMATG